MPFDALTILRGLNNAATPVLVNLDKDEVQAVVVTPNADGAYVVDLKKTAKKGLAIVMVLPTEPVDYGHTLTTLIEESDHLERNWQTLVTFPVINALMRKIKLTATTAFEDTDIGKTITKDTSLDAGVILKIDQALFTEGGVGEILLSMVDAADLFTLDANVGLTTNGVGAGDLLASGIAVPTKGVYIRRIVSSKRYIRGKYTTTVDAGANFGKVQVLVGDDQLDRL